MTSDIFRQITDEIVAALKAGARPWVRPWRAPGMPLRDVGLPYRGINNLKLWMEADARRYWSPYWMTEKQAMKYGGRIRSGEEGTTVVRPLVGRRTVNSVTGEIVLQSIPLVQPYEVFNAEQFDGLPERFFPGGKSAQADSAKERVSAADKFLLRAVGAKIAHRGTEAFYHPAEDAITMPAFERFRDAPSYYAILAHELVHWTGNRSRMNRALGRRFGDEAYAMEELVAELGSAFVMAKLQLPGRVRDDHASYVASWLRVLENDDHAIFVAASHAQKAADYLTVAAAAEKVAELTSRRLDDRLYIVIYLDQIKVGRHVLLVAIGLDDDGRKRLLGVGPSANDEHEQEQAAFALLRRFIDRGLRIDHGRLFVIGMSEPARRAIDYIFGPGILVQRCRSSFRRVVMGSLPEQAPSAEGEKPIKLRQLAGDVIQHAFENWREGTETLQGIVPLMKSKDQVTAARTIGNCLPDLFTIDRLGLDPVLRRTLSSTHMITQANAGLPRQICGIAGWQEREMAIRWAAASFLEMERGFRRVAGYRHLQRLKHQLRFPRGTAG